MTKRETSSSKSSTKFRSYLGGVILAIAAMPRIVHGQEGNAHDSSSVTGKWSVHRDISGNESDSVCTFTQTDKTLAGNCNSGDKVIVVAGTVDGNKVTWKYDIDYNGSPLTFTYSGILDDSGKISGSIDVQPYAVTGDFTAARVKQDSK